MLYTFLLVCAGNLLAGALLLLLLGSRVRFASRIAGVLLSAAVASGVSLAVEKIWALPVHDVVAAGVFVALLGTAVSLLRPEWNPLGQLFFACYLAAAGSYLTFAGAVTFAGGLSFRGALASFALLVLETIALVLAGSFTFETCDVVTRVRHSRRLPILDQGYFPRVSLHIAAYNEPPDMLIETIRSVESIDYPNFEVVVIDNNTHDEATWRPVEAYCAERPGVRFVHVDPWPGYKSGALNLALSEYTDPDAEIVGVVDADYLVDPAYLRSTVGYFAEPSVAFVQTPQDYRDYRGSTYFTACYDAYRYFFATAMPSRNERNSIIFAGTMGLLRRRSLTEIGGWDEWCITEDAETSLRLLKSGYQGMFVPRSFGKGVMPLTFASLKSQRFRWCFGGMQILRRHWKSLMPWDRSPDNRLSVGQRLDYLFGGLQWVNDLILLFFSVVLLVMAGLLIDGQHVAIRPLLGPTLVLPAALIFTGLVRALWALTVRTHISWKRALLAFASWLSLSFTVAWACVQGLTRKEGVFLRTPKTGGAHRLSSALNAARYESVLALGLWGSAAGLVVVASPTPLLVGLIVWQGAVYATSPAMAWLAQRAHLTPALERRRRTEMRRERLAGMLRPVAFGTAAALVGAAGALVVVLALGAGHAGHPSDPFSLPPRSTTVTTTHSSSTTLPSTSTTTAPHSTTTLPSSPTTKVTPTTVPTTSGSTTASTAASASGSPPVSGAGAASTPGGASGAASPSATVP